MRGSRAIAFDLIQKILGKVLFGIPAWVSKYALW